MLRMKTRAHRAAPRRMILLLLLAGIRRRLSPLDTRVIFIKTILSAPITSFSHSITTPTSLSLFKRLERKLLCFSSPDTALVREQTQLSFAYCSQRTMCSKMQMPRIDSTRKLL